jgi:serine/threonine protein kinase
LKYLLPEDIYLTSEGTIKIGGLRGATMNNYLKEYKVQPPSKHRLNGKKGKSGKGEHEDVWNGIVPSQYAHLTAPEILFGDSPSVSSNIYCLGTIAFYLLTGKPFVKVKSSFLFILAV